MDIEFIVQDTFQAIRPTWTIPTSVEEAGKAFEEAVAKTYKPEDKSNPAEPEEPEDADSSDEGETELREGEDEADAGLSDAEDDDPQTPGIRMDTQNSDESTSSSSEDEEEDIVVNMQEEQRDPEADAEFDRELAKMMQESLDARKFERKPLFDVPLPIKRAGSTLSMLSRESTFDITENGNGDSVIGSSSRPMIGPTGSGNGMMAFSLLTKKGNKQQTKTVELPSNSSLAMAMKNTQEAERQEKLKIKELVMNYDRMEETSELDGMSYLYLLS